MSLAATRLSAGVLAAVGALRDDLNDQSAADELYEVLRYGSTWTPGIRRVDSTDDTYLSAEARAAGRVALWRPPDEELVDLHTDVLNRAWATASSRLNDLYVDQWDQGTIRLAVRTLEHRSELLSAAADAEEIVAAIVARRSAGFSWRWPLEVSVVDGPHAQQRVDQLRCLDEHYWHLYSVGIVDPAALQPDGRIVVADIADLQKVPRTSTLLLVGDNSTDLTQVASMREDDTLLLCPSPDVSWFGEVVIALSHDHTLDSAIAIAGPDVTVLADPDLIGISSIRAHGAWMASQFDRMAEMSWAIDRGPDVELETGHQWQSPSRKRYSFDQVADFLRKTTEQGRFDSEQGSGSDVGAGGAALTRVSAESGTAFDVRRIEGAQAAMAAPSPSPPSASLSERFLQVRLRRTDHSEVIDSVTRCGNLETGEELRLSVAIAAELLRGAVTTGGAFPEQPTDVELDIAIYIYGVTPSLYVVPLYLPKASDSEFTDDIIFTCPDLNLTVMVAAFRDGRTIQTATFEMAVDLPDTAAQFTLDRPGSEWRERVRAVSLASFPGQTGPILVALDRGDETMSTELFTSSYDEIKAVLREGFNLNHTTIEDQWRTLARLAVLGRTLSIAIGAEDYDDTDWIHVVDFATADIPLELVYTHPISDVDAVTGLCPEAAAGAQECKSTCESRDRADVVCPNAFWATSKVIERRSHIAGRIRREIAQRRNITPRRSVAIALSSRMNENDAKASNRVIEAVDRLAAQREVATSWADLEVNVREISPTMIVLIPHTEHYEDEPPPNDFQLEIAQDLRPVNLLDARFVNSDGDEPGPLVLAIGCETGDIGGGFASLTELLHHAGAEAVITAIAKVPGAEVSQFVASFCDDLKTIIGEAGGRGRSLAEVMQRTRRSSLAKGNLVGLAVAMSGDGEVKVS